jgi:predicted signal transduction protein with EAL and GGDEF domain
VLLSDIPDAPAAREVAAKIMAACERPIEIQGTEFNVTFSMGVAMFPENAATTESLLSQADRAMFFAKEQGRNNVQFFSDVSRKDRNSQALYIQNRLATAIKARQLQVWFQPVVDAESRRIVACEALARWKDDIHGWIPPDTFIPMAENLGLIRELGRQVWHEALACLGRWRETGMDLKLAVNVSRRQLFAPNFTGELLKDLEQASIPVSCIELEITESVAIDAADHTSRRLRELVDAGFSISIDDFGRGYSSLSQLHEMPATTLKIDISFVRRIHDPQGAQLVNAIIHMAKAFGLQTVAEGVEDEPTPAMLRAHGVTMLQGYHFGRPMPSDELDRLLAKHRADGGPAPVPPPGT